MLWRLARRRPHGGAGSRAGLLAAGLGSWQRGCAAGSGAGLLPAGVQQVRAGRGAAAAAQVCVSSGDFELTSGACHVRRLGKRAGCAWLLQEVPDLTLLPPAKMLMLLLLASSLPP